MEHPEKRPKVVEHAKTVWLITYGSHCQDVSNTMLDECGLPVQECYTVQWRESKYTLIHLVSRMRHCTLEKKINEMNQKHDIIQTQITGYESVAGNCSKSELEHHPGFKKMIELANKRCPTLRAWIREKDVFTNKKGILWPYMEVDLDQASVSQMKKMLNKWKPMVKEYDDIKAAHDSLFARMGGMEAKLEIAEENLAFMSVALDRERTTSQKVGAELLEKRKECLDLQEELARVKAALAEKST